MLRPPLPILSDSPDPSPVEPGVSEATPSEKLAVLEQQLMEVVAEGLVVAVSGGVDSAFLLWAAERVYRRRGGRLLALTCVSDSVPEYDLQDAIRFTKDLGVEHAIERSQETARPEYMRNDGLRCYHCKTELFRIAKVISRRHGMRWIAYGYTASDRSDVRPGHRAALEGGVLSPLADVGFVKDDIRTLMREHRMELASKPASPCLSSRIMTGLRVTRGRLQDVAAMEAIVRSMGIRICRVRLCDANPGLFLRIEVGPEDMAKVVAQRDDLVHAAEVRGYRWVTLDLAGYRTGGGHL